MSNFKLGIQFWGKVKFWNNTDLWCLVNNGYLQYSEQWSLFKIWEFLWCCEAPTQLYMFSLSTWGLCFDMKSTVDIGMKTLTLSPTPITGGVEMLSIAAKSTIPIDQSPVAPPWCYLDRFKACDWLDRNNNR